MTRPSIITSGTQRNGSGLLAWVAATLAVTTGTLRAQSFNLPNGSFESEATSFVTVNVTSWQKDSKPAYFDESSFGFLWIQTAGLFANTPPGDSSHIDNLDGNQSAYLLAFPGVALSQDLTSPAVTFQSGLSYDLTVGLLGKGMADGNILTLSLYYRNGGNSPVTVASTVINYTAAGLPSTTQLTDFTVHVPTVSVGDAWAGKAIGVRLESTYGNGAGYWDVDKVRLAAVPEPEEYAEGAALALLGLAAWRRMNSRRQA